MEEQTRITIVLYPEDLETIDAADIGRAGRSPTIRRIIREWKQHNLRQLSLRESAPGYDVVGTLPRETDE